MQSSLSNPTGRPVRLAGKKPPKNIHQTLEYWAKNAKYVWYVNVTN